MASARLPLYVFSVLAFAGGARADNPTKYPFKVSPVVASERLAALEPSAETAFAPGERAFLDGSAGRDDPNAFAAAALWASGVNDARRRTKYLKRLDALTADARAKVEKAKTPVDKGKALLEFLHAGSMAKGYESHQSSLAVTLDAGTYNCVSSAVLYNVVARRLGLAVRAVEVPGGFNGHVYSVLDAGSRRVRVETTNARGFDQGKVELTGDARETGDLGLAALVYSNRCSELTKENRFAAGGRAGLGALALDPDNPTSAKNALAAFVNWGNHLSKGGQHEKALRVIEFGLALAPKDGGLTNNRQVAWREYADAAMAAGDAAEAVARLRKAAVAVPDGGFDKGQADLFIGPGHKLTEAGKWDDALALADRGLKVVDHPKAKEELERWRVDLYRLWSQAEIKKGAYEAGMAALVKGLAALPRERELHEGVAYLAQEWLAAADAAKGPAGAATAFDRLRKRFPDLKELAGTGAAHARRAVDKKVDAGRFSEATVAVAAYAPLVGGAKEVAKLGGHAYDSWARAKAQAMDWDAALKVYADGLKAFPGEATLTQNSIATVDEWAGKSISAKEYAEAVRIYQRGIELFGKDKHLLDNLEYCRKKLDKP